MIDYPQTARVEVRGVNHRSKALGGGGGGCGRGGNYGRGAALDEAAGSEALGSRQRKGGPKGNRVRCGDGEWSWAQVEVWCGFGSRVACEVPRRGQ